MLNDTVMVLKTQQLDLEIESMDGSLKCAISPYTTQHATMEMPAVDWSEVHQRWSHLRDIPFHNRYAGGIGLS